MRRRIFVFAYLDGAANATPAGEFVHDDDGRIGMFQYGTRYVQRPDAIAVDPVDCPLDRAAPAPTQLHDGLYGAFRDASPDYWGRMVIARRLKREAAALDPVDLLLEGGPSRVGALDFRDSLDAPEPDAAMPTLTTLRELVDAADGVRRGDSVAPELEELLRQGTSLGGMRPKCVIEAHGALWLAKFPAQEDSFDNPRVEAATMALARTAGIDVAETRLHVLPDERAVLLVRRFDRERRDTHYARSAFASALTLLGSSETDRARWSYPALAQSLRRLAIGQATLAQLFRRMAFNVAIRNVDDHPRNHGVLYDHRDYRLAPAYDLTPHAARRGVSTEFDLAMDVGSRGRIASVENLLSQSAQFGLAPDSARQVVREVGEIASHGADFLLAGGVPRQQVEKFEASFDLAKEMQTA